MSEYEPLVSIVTPSLNQGSFIEETILSVKNQTYPNIEHIVVDGGSIDSTLDTLRKHSDHIKWISEPDEGQSDAINKGCKEFNGGEIDAPDKPASSAAKKEEDAKEETEESAEAAPEEEAAEEAPKETPKEEPKETPTEEVAKPSVDEPEVEEKPADPEEDKEQEAIEGDINL